MKRSFTLAAALLSLSATTAFALTEAGKRIRADIDALSSDELNGRRAGTADADRAAAYVESAFRRIGLLPAGVRGTYRQSFDFVDAVDLGPKNALATSGSAPIGRTWSVGTDYRPLAFSAAGTIEGDVVFAGYGIVAKELSYDDYQGIDVNGKIVLVLRYGPEGADPKSRFWPYVALRQKAAAARERGAKALLVATGPNTRDVSDDLVALRTDASFSDAGLVALSLKRPVAESLFGGSGTTLADAQKAVDEKGRPAPLALRKARVSAVADVTPRRSKTSNVLGLLPGADPSRNTEFVVVGAHYDHLGLGGAGSLEEKPEGKIHHGADDNASGVAGVLELARSLVPMRGVLKRSILFVAFGAEEEGTLGSLHFTKSPTVPLESVVAMVNLDMVGRLRDDRLAVHGVGTSPAWKPLVAKANEGPGLKLALHEGGFGPSDHATFFAARRPVLFLFTGNHADYHRATDTVEKINVDGLEKVLRFLAPVVTGVANGDERPAFAGPAAEKR